MQNPPHDVSRGAPPEAWEPLLRLAKRAGRPLERFLQIEAASGILLFLAAAVALGWANSPWARSYVALWDTPLGVRIGDFSFERSLAWFVNDGLMVVFFFVVGMEIRREIHHGELSEWRRAALPAAAALGGMIVPALLYLVVASAGPTRAGWGVPMATDIAFAVGVLTLLGKRVPAALRVLLLALAVIDDLGAIIVIALFYSPGVSLTGLLAAMLGVLILLTMQAFGVRSKAAFLVPAVIVWAGVYTAGVHPTIAGVILGLLTPVRAWLGPKGFVQGIAKELDHLSHADTAHGGSHALAETLRHIDFVRREAMSPAENQIEALHPWVAFVIMPVFALANAGVSLSGVSLHDEALRVTTGASLGLLLGKPIGVMLACALALRVGVAALPLGLSARHVVVLGVTAGIGFTMALFIAQLAFVGSAPLLGAAKLGVLAASGAATAIALALGFALLREHAPPGTALTADEAEASTEALALAAVGYRLSAVCWREVVVRGGPSP